jgi:two-component system OmpR family response regulator
MRMIEESAEGFDLVVLDLMLPGMSGYAVCERIRAAGLDLPVLILSARTLAEDRTRGFDVGADQYLMKPFDLDELLSRVRNLLVRHGRRNDRVAAPPSESAVYSFGQAHINFDTYDVTVAGRKVRLTPLEMKLLRYFVENQGRVVPREELLERVWDMPGHLYTRAPDQFIRRLRKTFEQDPSAPRHFLTLRDAGYRFVPQPDDNG